MHIPFNKPYLTGERDTASCATYTAEEFTPLFAAEDRHFWFRSRNRCMAAVLRSLPQFTDFTDIYVTQFIAALFPPMWLKRRLLGEGATKLSQANPQQQQAAVESDLKASPLVNWRFELLLRPEVFFISRHLRMPLGTSLLPLATRPMQTATPPSHA